MSTRSLTTVRSRFGDREWTTHATIYRHHNGYPEGHGAWLFEFLNGLQVINGKTGNESGKWVNGPGRLASLLVHDLWADDHEPDLTDEGDCGQEYHYIISVQFGFDGGAISVQVMDGPMCFFGAGGDQCTNSIFEGSVEQFGEFLNTVNS